MANATDLPRASVGGASATVIGVSDGDRTQNFCGGGHFFRNLKTFFQTYPTVSFSVAGVAIGGAAPVQSLSGLQALASRVAAWNRQRRAAKQAERGMARAMTGRRLFFSCGAQRGLDGRRDASGRAPWIFTPRQRAVGRTNRRLAGRRQCL
jgi:hypothetical protein